ITQQMGVQPQMVAEKGGSYRAGKSHGLARHELQRMIQELEKQMKEAARNLEFERAAALRDEMFELKALLVEESDLTPLQRVRLLTGEE
ncbi:MAG: UvrB/UvrC motif-containing protein, partial [Anaerolineae bacterium]|nr:UvrB/UvrC motif-containing protein [Anaerolineae bacterium]